MFKGLFPRFRFFTNDKLSNKKEMSCRSGKDVQFPGSSLNKPECHATTFSIVGDLSLVVCKMKLFPWWVICYILVSCLSKLTRTVKWSTYCHVGLKGFLWKVVNTDWTRGKMETTANLSRVIVHTTYSPWHLKQVKDYKSWCQFSPVTLQCTHIVS